MKLKIIGVTPEQFVKRFFFLAWKASRVVGMGALQDRGEQSEDEVWKRIANGGDIQRIDAGASADYIFGRMMKMPTLRWDNETVTIPEGRVRSDYQSWCSIYQSYPLLVAAVANNLNCGVVETN